VQNHLGRRRAAAQWLTLIIGCFGLLAFSPAGALARSASANARREIMALFGEEMQQAALKLKWRGERLTEDTVYAVALTGLSWETAWGKERPFSLAWGDWRKLAGKRGGRNAAGVIEEARHRYEAHDCDGAVVVASSDFSPEEIGCDPVLKEAVGQSLLALGRPEQAFPVFASPFDPSRGTGDVRETDRRFREAAFEAARRANLTKEAVAFGLSLLLDPGQESAGVNQKALAYLESLGVEIDRVLLGILQAPERLRGIAAYVYPAADLLAYRASPRLLPFLLHLANSDDVHLRGRAVLGLGIMAYQARPGEPSDWAGRVVWSPLREYGLSVGERKLIAKEIREAADSDRYRLRVAAAQAAALVADDESLPLLQKLAKDRAYTLSPAERDKRAPRRLVFPVREAAAAGLARYGIQVDPGGGEFAGKALDRARRGGDDQTNDRRNLRRDAACQIAITPLDSTTAPPFTLTQR